MTMNMRNWLLATACAIALCAPLQSQTDNSTSAAKQTDNSAKDEKNTVKKLDGTKLFGFVEITDDYTIRITNDSGITRLPIAQLSDADFQKYGFQKDRTKDGRFWYERKEALKSSEEDPKSDGDPNIWRKVSRRDPTGGNLGISTFHRGLRKDTCFQEQRKIDRDKQA